jgi:hypothetical protein
MPTIPLTILQMASTTTRSGDDWNCCCCWMLLAATSVIILGCKIARGTISAGETFFLRMTVAFRYQPSDITDGTEVTNILVKGYSILSIAVIITIFLTHHFG